MVGVVTLKGDRFQNTGSNAVELDVQSPQNDPSLVEDDLFNHNQRLGLFDECGRTGSEPCLGGQIYIYQTNGLTANVFVTHNLFENGYPDSSVPSDIITTDGGVDGVELERCGPSGVSENVTVDSNGFINDNSAIVLDGGSCSSSSGLVFTNNVFNSISVADIITFGYSGTINESGNIDGNVAQAQALYG